MSKKSVCIVADLYPPAFSPRIFNIVKTLINNGFDVVVFTEEQKDHLIFTSYDDLCDSYRLNLLGENNLKRTINRISEFIFQCKESAMISNIKRIFKEKNINSPDIVLCFCYRKFPIKASCEISKLFSVPLIVDCRDIVEQQKDFIHIGFGFNIIGRLFEKIVIRQRNKYLKEATAITTVSQWHRDKLLSYLPDKNVKIIYNGYDRDLFTPSHPQNEYFNIIFTGRLNCKKFRDPTLLLQAVKELERECPYIKLSFYTDKKSAKIIKLTNNGINCNLNIFDFVDHKQIPLLLRTASVIALISSSFRYGGGYGMISTKIFEALAMEKPVVLFSDTESQAADIIRESCRGISTDSKDEIKDFIKQQYQSWESDGYCKSDCNKDFVMQFDRDNQNLGLVELINDILK